MKIITEYTQIVKSTYFYVYFYVNLLSMKMLKILGNDINRSIDLFVNHFNRHKKVLKIKKS